MCLSKAHNRRVLNIFFVLKKKTVKNAAQTLSNIKQNSIVNVSFVVVDNKPVIIYDSNLFKFVNSCLLCHHHDVANTIN